MKKAENHENHPRRSWALNHMGNPSQNMKTKHFTSLCIVAVTGIMGVASAQTLLLNGDFSSPNVSVETAYSVGSSIPGWTVVGTGNVVVIPGEYWPGNTSQFLDLTGFTGGAGIQSDAFSTTVGQTYQITFDAYNWSSVYPGNNYTGPTISLEAAGSPVRNYNGVSDMPPGISEVLTYSFTAASDSTTLTFMELSGHDYNSGWIDNLTIQTVPEPSAAAMMILCGFVSPFFVRRYLGIRK